MKKIFGFLIIGLALIVYSCQKDDSQQSLSGEAELLKSAEIATNNDKLELALSDVQYESDFYSGIEKLLWMQHKAGIRWGWFEFSHYMKGKCPDIKITAVNDSYPKTITLDYGDNTVLHFGRVLKGKIIIEISAAPGTNGATRKVTYSNFAVDTITINGTSSVVFSGDWTKTAKSTYTDDITFKYTNGKVIKWQGVKVREWKEGLATQMDMRDDVIEITGKVNAEIVGSDKYLKEITSPLIRKGNCMFIVKGVISLTVNSKLHSKVDYGSGNCDAVAMLTKDGETVEIDLARHIFHHLKGK